MNQMKITATALAVIALITGGCAVTPHEVNLDLVPQVQSYETTQVPSTPIYVSVVDDRESTLMGQRSTVGAKITMAELLPEVTAAVRAMFTHKGYQLVPDPQDTATVRVRLRGAKFDYTMGFWTIGQHVSAVLSLTAQKEGAREYEATYRSEAEKRKLAAAFGEEVDQLSNHHLSEVIRQIADDDALHAFLTD